MMEAVDSQRRRFAIGLLAAGVAAPLALRAQPRIDVLRIIHGYPPGGSIDIVSRALAEKLAGRYCTHAIVDNKSGAAGRIAIDEVKRARADGSVMLVAPASALTLYPHVYRQLGYDVFADLAPVSTVASTGFALAIGPRVPPSIDSFESFRQWCRTEPAAPQCGNPGAGSLPHLMCTLVAREAGIALGQVPYRGGSLAMQAAAAGEVAAALSTEASARPLQQAGKLRILATTWSERSPFFPQVPTFKELGMPALAQREWFGAFMPGRTPTVTVQSAADALRSALSDADLRETWDRAFLGVEASTPAQLQAAIRSEYEFWAPVVKASGFTPEG
jgi:tripartite-type tricarboxylate transporter receptor subunit TctC